MLNLAVEQYQGYKIDLGSFFQCFDPTLHDGKIPNFLNYNLIEPFGLFCHHRILPKKKFAELDFL